MYNAIICRYHEIAIKGNNRRNFERQLMNNMQHALKEVKDLKVRSIRGRVWLEHTNRQEFTTEELEIIKRNLKFMFGLESFSPAVLVESAIENIENALKNTADSVFKSRIEKSGSVSFRIRARRSIKTFPLCSKDIEINLATIIGDMYGLDHVKVNLDEDADITVGCEVRGEFTILFYETLRSGGGLPVGSNSPVMALLSGGIDSPVACLLTMKRGSEVDFMSFHSAPYTPPATEEKVLRIGRYLNQFQRRGRHYFANLSEIQKLVRDNCDPHYRTILYRRMMFRIAEMVCKKGRAKALLTGESLGQVASQTVENMTTINAATNMLVLRPLVGHDKLETIKLAEKYGTLELSNEQVPDSCTVFLPSSPATKSDVRRIEGEEAKMGDYQAVLEKIVEEITVY